MRDSLENFQMNGNDSNSTDVVAYNNFDRGLVGLYPNKEAMPSIPMAMDRTGLNYVRHVSHSIYQRNQWTDGQRPSECAVSAFMEILSSLLLLQQQHRCRLCVFLIM